MHPKFNPVGIRTHDLQDHDSSFHVTETAALTTWPSVTSGGCAKESACILKILKIYVVMWFYL